MFVNVVFLPSSSSEENRDTMEFVDSFQWDVEGKVLPFKHLLFGLLDDMKESKSPMAFFLRHSLYDSHFGEIPTPPPDIFV